MAQNYLKQDQLFHTILHLPVVLAAVSSAVQDILQQEFGRASLMIPNGIDCERFHPGPYQPLAMDNPGSSSGGGGSGGGGSTSTNADAAALLAAASQQAPAGTTDSMAAAGGDPAAAAPFDASVAQLSSGSLEMLAAAAAEDAAGALADAPPAAAADADAAAEFMPPAAAAAAAPAGPLSPASQQPTAGFCEVSQSDPQSLSLLGAASNLAGGPVCVRMCVSH